MNTIDNNSVTVLPGELCFSSQPVSYCTLLGSCVAVVVWHPNLRVGGICHFVLPTRKINADNHSGEHPQLDGRYADEAMQLFIREISIHRTKPSEYRVCLYGGANMFQSYSQTCADIDAKGERICSGCSRISCLNRQAAYREISQHGFSLHYADMGGTAYRHIQFNTVDGSLVIKRTDVQAVVSTKNGLSL